MTSVRCLRSCQKRCAPTSCPRRRADGIASRPIEEMSMNQHQQPASASERIPVIDVDFPPMPRHTDAQVAKFLPQKWQAYISKYGLGQGSSSFTGSPAQREFTHRLDALDPQGRVGFDPLWCKRQVLDEYDLTAAILTGVSPMVPCGPNSPLELSAALNR